MPVAYLLGQMSKQTRMKFGNWNITEAGIEWAGGGRNRFFINQEDLVELSKESSQAGLYKWPLVAMEEDWITDNDLYDLNFAFVYAAAHARLDFDYDVFDRTLEYQYDVLDDEDDDDDDGHPSLNSLTAEDAEAEQRRKEGLSGRD